MKPVSYLALAVAALALAACYESDTLLLDASQPATPLAAGDFHDVAEPGDEVQVSLGPDRWYVVSDRGPKETAIGEGHRLLFTALPSADPQRFAFAYEDGRAFVYGLARRASDGQVYFDLPSCTDMAARDAAKQAGATVGDQKSLAPTCHFKDRRSLLDALQRYAAAPAPPDAEPQRHLPAAPP